MFLPKKAIKKKKKKRAILEKNLVTTLLKEL